MEGVKIIDLDLVKSDEKGDMFEFENRNAPSMILIKRKKGTMSGAHYHTDENEWKNPETVILIEGKIELHLKNVKTGEEFKQVYDKPTKFKIDPFIYHAIKALTDIILIDMNSVKDDKLGRIKGDKLV